MVFKSFELIGPEEGEATKFEHYSYGLNYFIQRSKKMKLRSTYIDLRKFQCDSSDCMLKRL